MWMSQMKQEQALFVCRRRTRYVCRSGRQGGAHRKRIEEYWIKFARAVNIMRHLKLLFLLLSVHQIQTS